MQSETIAELSTFAAHDATQLSPDLRVPGGSNIVPFGSDSTAANHAENQLELNFGGEFATNWLPCSDCADGVPRYRLSPKSELSEEDSAQMYGWLTLQQVITITAAIVNEAGVNLFTRSECDRALDWADKTIANYGLLQTVLDGSLKIRLREDGEPFFVMPKGNSEPVCP